MSIPSAVKAKDLGNLAFKQGNLILALSNYSNAIELDRSNYIYPLNRSAVYLKQSNWKLAEKDCTKALNLEPNLFKAFLRRSVARRELKNYIGARKDLEEARKIKESPEIENELIKLNLISPPPTPSLPTPTPTLTPISSPTAPAPILSPTTAKLRAALSNSTLTKPLPSSSSTSITTFNEFMTESSTRRFTKSTTPNITTTTTKNEFTKKKEERDSRLTPSFNKLPSSSTTTTSLPIASKSTEVDSIPIPFISKPILESVTSIKSIEKKEKEIFVEIPKSAIEFESCWCSLKTMEEKIIFLKSLDSNSLTNIFGSYLTPEILEEIIKTFSFIISSSSPSSTTTPISNSIEEIEFIWIIQLLKGFLKVKRIKTVIGFLENSELVVIRELLRRGREEIDTVEKGWLGA